MQHVGSFNGLLLATAIVLIWSSLVLALGQLGNSLFGNSNYVANPVLYFVIPVIVLLILGARFTSLGFGRGHRVVRVALIWCSLPILICLYQIVGGGVPARTMLNRFISNAFNNGFFEEFLFRGALQTRLRALLTPAWAWVLQALAFGVWHVGLGSRTMGDLATGLASTILLQATMGLCFGVMFARSRNLLVPSIFHILVNSMGI